MSKELRVCLNDKVILNDYFGSQGIVKYIGEIFNKEGIFYGVDLSKGNGKNNGSFNKQFYFQTRGNRKTGKFTKLEKIKRVIGTDDSINYTVGDEVGIKTKNKNGIIRCTFIKNNKTMLGVQLHDPKGIHNGSYRKMNYFSCPSKHGIYIEADKVTKVFISRRKKQGKKIKIQTPNQGHTKGTPQQSKFCGGLCREKTPKNILIKDKSLSPNSPNLKEAIDFKMCKLFPKTPKIILSNNNNDSLSPNSNSPNMDSSLSPNSALKQVINGFVDDDLVQNGYEKVSTIYDCKQYELILAEIINLNNVRTERRFSYNKRDSNTLNQKMPRFENTVIIKKVSKTLNMQSDDENESDSEEKSESTDSDEEIEEYDEEYIDVIKEALILHHLTMDNQDCNGYIVKFVKFFDSECFHYFAVEDYESNNMNLEQFVPKAHEYINNGAMKLREYQKTIKYILWQISVTLYWLHCDMACCHLNIIPKNIYLKDCRFISRGDGDCVSINPSISIKICGFGESELFKDGCFECEKVCQSLDCIEYISPKAYEGKVYDARKADVWSLGILAFYCYIGHPLFVAFEEDENESSEYWAVQKQSLKEYVNEQNLKKKLNAKVVDLLTNLLRFDEEKRYDVKQVIEHKWMSSYYAKYKDRILQKSKTQKVKLKKQKKKLSTFPFYNTEDDDELINMKLLSTLIYNTRYNELL